MSTLTATQLQQQYIAYFGRPGDPAGIKYWLSSSSGISSAREFADKIYAQDEYKKSTVGTKSTEEQVNQLYVNLFGRQADASGLLYWTGEIENGSLSLSNIAFDLIAAANNPLEANSSQGALDAKALASKVSAAEAFTTSLESDTAGILAYQPESTDPWKSGASFASAVSFIATATDSNTPTAADVSAAVVTMSSAKPSTGSAASGQTFKFTKSTDALVGDSGNDTFTGILLGAGLDGTTAQPGDSIEGGAGTDTFTISAAGAITGADYTVAAVSTTGVEKVLISNFETSTFNTIVDTALMSGLTTIGLGSSSATGDTTFTGLKSIISSEMRNGSGDLTLTYNSAPIDGSSDTQTLNVSALTNGTFTVDGVETLGITSELVKSKLKDVSGSALTKITVDGAAKLTVTDALTEKTIDASASTGGVDLTLGVTTAQTVTGGSGDDVIRAFTGVASTDTISGGSGTDTLTLEIGDATYDGKSTGSNKQLSAVSGIETLEVSTTHANATVELDNVTGIKTLVADDTSIELVIAGANSQTDGTATVVVAGNTYTTGTLDMSSGTNTVDHAIIATALADKINAADDGTTAVATAASLNIRRSDGDILTATFSKTSITNYTGTQQADETISFTKAAGDEVLDIYKAGTVKLRLADPSGTEDVANINLKTNTDNKATAQTIADVDVKNTETVNLSVTGMKDGVTKTLSAFSGDNTLTTLNITGDSDFELTDLGTDNAKLATVNASTSTGDLTLKGTSAGATFGQTITTGVGNDLLAFDTGELTEHDVVDLGGNTVLSTGKMGTDTVTHTGNHGSAVNQQKLTVSNVEDLQLTAAGGAGNAGTFYLDTSTFTNVDKVSVAAASGTAKFTNLDTNTSIGLGVGADDFSGTVNVALADETGTSDSVTLSESSTLDASSGITFKSTGIETLNFVATTDATSAETTTFTFGDNAPATIIATKGQAADTLALGTLNKATNVVDASAFDGILSITGTAADVAMTVSAKMGSASGIHSITTNNKNDTFNLGEYGTARHVLGGGTGTDVLNTTLTSAASDFTSVSGFETLNLTIKNETDAGTNDAAEEGGLQAAKTINVLGGNSLSTYTVATAMLSAGTTTLFDASTFAGKTEITLEEDEFANTLTLKAGGNSKDKLTLNVDAGTGNKIASMTGFELLSISTDDGDTDGVIELDNVDGLTEITVTTITTSSADGLTIKKVDTGTKIKITPTHILDVLTLTSSDSSLEDTTMSVELLDSADSTAYILDLNATNVEVLNLKQSNDHGNDDGFNLAGVTADTDLNTTVNVEGLATTLKAMGDDITTVDGTTMTGALTIAAADRTTSAMTITGGLGGDALSMQAGGDVIDSGLGTDTLTITANGVLGGFAIDLTSTTDQVTQFGGVANAGVQKGFEHVSLAGVTGAYGGDITGTKNNDTITGSIRADVIRGGKGSDTITSGGGSDEIHTGAGADDVIIDNAIDTAFDGTLNAASMVTIKDFTVGTGGDQFSLSLSDLEAGLYNWEEADSDGGDVTAATTTLTAAVTGDATDLATLSGEILVINSALITSATGPASQDGSFINELQTAGGLTVLSQVALAANDFYVVAFDDNVDSYIAQVIAGGTVGDGIGILDVAGYKVNLLAKFEGVPNVTSITIGDNWLDIAA